MNARPTGAGSAGKGWRRILWASEVCALADELWPHGGDVGELSTVCAERGGHARGMSGRKSGAHHPPRGACTPVAVDVAAGGEQVVGVDAAQRAEWNVETTSAGDEAPLRRDSRTGVVFDRPCADGDRVVEAGGAQYVVFGQPIAGHHVARFAGAQLGAGADDVGVRTAKKGAHDLQVRA